MPHTLKSIPESRDRSQSRFLVVTIGGILSLFALLQFLSLVTRISGVGMPRRYHAYPHEPWIWFVPWIVSLTFAALVWAVRAATKGGIFFGATVCLALLLGSRRSDIWHSGLTPLIALFLLTFAASKAGKRRKQKLGVALDLDEKRGRSAAQVIANLGMAGLAAITGFLSLFDNLIPYAGYFAYSNVVTPVLITAALAEATADTVSSEIGQAFGGTPILLTTLRRVPPGTDGAVSILGTAAGVLSAAIVAAISLAAMHMTLAYADIALAAATAGLFFDSILGATVERKGWLGNDLVNFASTAFAALFALLLLLAFH